MRCSRGTKPTHSVHTHTHIERERENRERTREIHVYIYIYIYIYICLCVCVFVFIHMQEEAIVQSLGLFLAQLHKVVAIYKFNTIMCIVLHMMLVRSESFYMRMPYATYIIYRMIIIVYMCIVSYCCML